jgi:hypothetical protein
MLKPHGRLVVIRTVICDLADGDVVEAQESLAEQGSPRDKPKRHRNMRVQ